MRAPPEAAGAMVTTGMTAAAGWATAAAEPAMAETAVAEKAVAETAAAETAAAEKAAVAELGRCMRAPPEAALWAAAGGAPWWPCGPRPRPTEGRIDRCYLPATAAAATATTAAGWAAAAAETAMAETAVAEKAVAERGAAEKAAVAELGRWVHRRASAGCCWLGLLSGETWGLPAWFRCGHSPSRRMLSLTRRRESARCAWRSLGARNSDR
eukprot:scaffold69176_cov60-Phaeocystis_antarctica.AAC.3